MERETFDSVFRLHRTIWGEPTILKAITPQGVFNITPENYDNFANYVVFGFVYSSLSNTFKIQCKEMPANE